MNWSEVEEVSEPGVAPHANTDISTAGLFPVLHRDTIPWKKKKNY